MPHRLKAISSHVLPMPNNNHTAEGASGFVLEQGSVPSARTGRRIAEHGTVFGLALLAGWVARQQLSQVNDIAFAAGSCALGALLLLVAGRPAIRRGPSMRRVVLTTLLIAWCGGSLGWTALHSLTRLPADPGVQIWSVFHYHLGAKYFPELGYTDLYDQALAADAEGENNWADISSVRNLETYEVERVGRERAERSTVWSDARWADFKSDTAFLAPYASPDTWRRIFRDRGYNPPPSMTALRRPLVAIGLRPATLVLLGSLDLIVLLASFLIVGRVFGPLRAMVCATWVALYFGNVGSRFVGVPFLYDYLAALLLMACALKRNRYGLAGALLGYAAMMRVFPVILVVGVAWWAVLQGKRGWNARNPALRVAAGFTCACIVLFVVGLGSGRGAAGWQTFVTNLSKHTEQHVVGSQRIGLAHLFTVDWSNPPATDQRKTERMETFLAQKKTWGLVAGGMILLWLWATARMRGDLFDTAATAMILIFCIVVLSRYYWSAACLLMLAGKRVRGFPLTSLGPVSIAAALFGWSAAVHGYELFEPDDLHRYLFANSLGTLLIVTGLALLILRAGRSADNDEAKAIP